MKNSYFLTCILFLLFAGCTKSDKNSTFPKNAYRMTFTENHDKNSWEGNQYLNFGEGLEASMILACTVNGMPLVYSGQEAGLDRSLKFFDKDEIQWKRHRFADIYTKLFTIKASK